jgi:hypothetical protein
VNVHFSWGILELCYEENDVDKLRERIEKAQKIFVYCSAIAEEGGVRKDDSSGKEYIDRTPYQEHKKENIENENEFDSFIKVLYPHRLTQFVDLGKFFIATCKAILLLSKSEYKYNIINKLLDGLLTNPTNSNTDKILKQKSFNGHLATHVAVTKRYFEQIGNRQLNPSLFEIRDKVLTDIFKIVRGEDVKP